METRGLVYPMSVGSISRFGWSLFRFAWRPILLSAAAFLVPAFVISTMFSMIFGTRVDEWLEAWNTAVQNNFPNPQLPPDFAIAVVARIVSTILTFICSFLAVAAIVNVVDNVYRGQAASSRHAVGVALRRTLALVVGELLYIVALIGVVLAGVVIASVLVLGGGFLVFLGLVVLVGTFAALLFIAVRTSLLVQAVVLEGVGGIAGLGRSWRIVSGSGWRVLGYLLLISLLTNALGLLLNIPVSLLGLNDNDPNGALVDGVLSCLIAVLLSPVTPIALTLLFYELRWQRGERVPQPGGGETAGRPDAEPRPVAR